MAKRGRKPKRKYKDFPSHWVPCDVTNCENKVSPESEVAICYSCRSSSRYHINQGVIHCVLYKKRLEKYADRADKFNVATGVKMRKRHRRAS